MQLHLSKLIKISILLGLLLFSGNSFASKAYHYVPLGIAVGYLAAHHHYKHAHHRSYGKRYYGYGRSYNRGYYGRGYKRPHYSKRYYGHGYKRPYYGKRYYSYGYRKRY